MPRKAAPWLRGDRGWYAWIGGKQRFLAKDRDEAFREWHRLQHEAGRSVVGRPDPGDEPVVWLLDRFLLWVRANRAKPTYESYLARIKSFQLALPNPSIYARALRASHLQAWVDAHPKWNDGMKRGRIMAIQTALTWCARQGLIDHNPIALMRKPQQGARDNPLSQEEFEKLLSFVRNARFRDLLILSWETGARPQELLRVEARHVDLARSRWIFPRSESKGKKRARVILLSDTALEISRRLVSRLKPSARLLRNARGLPWTPYAVNCNFCRLAKKGKFGRKVALVDLRHSFATRKLIAGVDALTVAELMGHRDATMLSRHYSHIYRDMAFLRAALAK